MHRRQLLRTAGLVAAAAAIPGCATWARPPGQACSGDGSATAGQEIPARLAEIYRQAAAGIPGVGWTLLAAIGWVESRHQPEAIGPPLDGGPGIQAIPASDYGTQLHGDAQWEHAVGLMQFLPDTFRRHRPSPDASPLEPADAAGAAAAYLADVGAARDLPQAIYRYNRSWDYVDQVMTKAAAYDASGQLPRDCTPDPASPIHDIDADPQALVTHPAVHVDAQGAADLRHTRMDPRVIALLARLAQRHTIAISMVKTGHSRCVGGGSTCPADDVSHHWHYRAADIWRINDQPVSDANLTAGQVVQWTTQMDKPLRPDEVGSPFATWTHIPGWFTDRNHDGHIHLGYNAA